MTFTCSVVWPGVTIEECRALVQATKASKAVYMMAEAHLQQVNVLVKELVRRGLFGEVYYAEGEYLHELKGLNEITKWRRRWRTGIDAASPTPRTASDRCCSGWTTASSASPVRGGHHVPGSTRRPL